MKTDHLRYDTLSLKDLAEELHLNYYDILAGLLSQATLMLEELKRADLHQTAHTYIETCAEVLDCMKQYLHGRKEQLVPYLQELHSKDAAGHDCRYCKGGCDVPHFAHLMNLQESHGKLRKLFYELQSAALPLYSPMLYPAVYRKLREEMMLIDTIARELFYIEESVVMPKIVQSQKKINVRTR